MTDTRKTWHQRLFPILWIWISFRTFYPGSAHPAVRTSA